MWQQGVEAFAFRVDRERRKLQRQTPSAKAQVDPNRPKERAGDGCPKERVDSYSPDNRASNGCLKTRSTKVPTKSRHGFSVETVNKYILSRDNFPLQEKTRLQALAQMTSLTTRQREQPSGHTKGPLQQEMG